MILKCEGVAIWNSSYLFHIVLFKLLKGRESRDVIYFVVDDANHLFNMTIIGNQTNHDDG